MADQVAPLPTAEDIIPTLKQMYLFSRLKDEELSSLALRFDRYQLDKDALLFSQGEAAQSFFVILKGGIAISRRGRDKQEIPIGKLVAGDYIGETGLLRSKPRNATAIASEPTEVLQLKKEQFQWMIKQHPVVLKILEATVRSYELASRKGFSWLAPGEPVHMIMRRHPILLAISLSFPVIFLLISIGLILTGAAIRMTIFEFVGFAGVAVGSVWFLWNYIDWANDYYIITDRRVVWLEEILFIYESRHETPLSQVQSVDVESTLWQRFLGIGDVIVRTFSGNVTMTSIGSPELFKAPIMEYRQRVQKTEKMLEGQNLTNYIQDRISNVDPRIARPPIPAAEAPTGPIRRSKISWLNNVLKTRFEKDGVITYRKHWFLLLRRVLGFLLGFFALLVLFLLRLFAVYEFLSIGALAGALAIYFFVTLPFWGYQYLDWRNDQYQLTDKSIIDVAKKPLSTEVKKSALLENVLSVTNRSEGIIDRFLNIGTVDIRVGDATFSFIGVHKPAEVQEEIFERYYARKRALEKEAERKKHDEMLNVLTRYHQIVKDSYVPSDPGGINQMPGPV